MRIDKRTIVALSFVVATLLGNGALWQLAQYRIEAQKIALEAEKRKIEKISESIRLREKLNDLLYKITGLAGQYQEVLKAKKEGEEKIGPFTTEQKLVLLNTEFDQLISDFNTIESNLASIEGRQPRKINLDFRPPRLLTGVKIAPR